MPSSITFIGDYYTEAKVMLIAKTFQDATKFHLKRPKLLP